MNSDADFISVVFAATLLLHWRPRCHMLEARSLVEMTRSPIFSENS